MKLSDAEKVKYARIIYSSGRGSRRRNEVDSLNHEQLQHIRELYAQKIIYETAHGEMPIFEAIAEARNYEQQTMQESLLTSIFWCFYPENNRQFYNVPTTLFLKRVLYPFLFWKSGFFTIDEDNVEHYGQTWMVLTYAVMLFLAANLTNFYVDPVQFKPDYTLVGKTIILVYIFKTVEPMLHSAVMDCLGANITTDQCMMLSGYSLVLYLLPTAFCAAPSIYWRSLMLLVGSLFRVIFLYRNYCSRLDTRRLFLLLMLIVIQVIYGILVYRTLFIDYALGYGFYEAFSAVFGITPSDTQSVGTAGGHNATNTTDATHNLANMGLYSLRRFEI